MQNRNPALPAGTYYPFVDSIYVSGSRSSGRCNLSFKCLSSTDSSGEVRYAVTSSFGYCNFEDLPVGGPKDKINGPVFTRRRFFVSF